MDNVEEENRNGIACEERMVPEEQGRLDVYRQIRKAKNRKHVLPPT